MYKDLVDFWLFFDNSKPDQELIAEGKKEEADTVHNEEKWKIIKKYQ